MAICSLPAPPPADLKSLSNPPLISSKFVVDISPPPDFIFSAASLPICSLYLFKTLVNGPICAAFVSFVDLDNASLNFLVSTSLPKSPPLILLNPAIRGLAFPPDSSYAFVAFS